MGILYRLHKLPFKQLWRPGKRPQKSLLASAVPSSRAWQRPPLAANSQSSRAKLQRCWIQNRENVNPAKQTVGRVITYSFSSLGFEMLVSDTNYLGPQQAARIPCWGKEESVRTQERTGEFYLRGFPSARNWVHCSPTNRCRYKGRRMLLFLLLLERIIKTCSGRLAGNAEPSSGRQGPQSRRLETGGRRLPSKVEASAWVYRLRP